MITKLLSIGILALVFYGGAVFFMPQVSEQIDDLLGISGISEHIRAGKSGLEAMTQTLAQSQISGTGGIVDRVNTAIARGQEIYQETLATIEETRDLIDTKTQELETVIDSVSEAKDSIDRIRENLDTLTTLSGSQEMSDS